MKIALFGYGKMGKLVEQVATERGDSIVAVVRRNYLQNTLADADVCIDFSHADCILEHVHTAGKAGISIIIGTTGWDHMYDEVKHMVAHYGIGMLHSPNFSVGVQLFRRIVEEAAKMMKNFPIYDVGGIEMHHHRKADAPSGTAKMLADILVKGLCRKDPLIFSHVRCGEIPGTHTITFDSAVDTITLTHQARNREGFALGALEAARWLQGKIGCYQLEDMIS